MAALAELKARYRSGIRNASARKNYDKLGDLERFQLIMSAYARGDESEVQALWLAEGLP
jgi:hypothetical protein